MKKSMYSYSDRIYIQVPLPEYIISEFTPEEQLLYKELMNNGRNTRSIGTQTDPIDYSKDIRDFIKREPKSETAEEKTNVGLFAKNGRRMEWNTYVGQYQYKLGNYEWKKIRDVKDGCVAAGLTEKQGWCKGFALFPREPVPADQLP